MFNSFFYSYVVHIKNNDILTLMCFSIMSGLDTRSYSLNLHFLRSSGSETFQDV